MKKYGLIGKDISYSLSPLIHNYLLDKYKIEGNYELIDIANIGHINKNTLLTYSGLNITIPYKENIIQYVDNINENIIKLKSINTIEKDGDKLIGHNTDILGFDKFFTSNIKDNIKTIGILGSGGTSKMLEYYFEQSQLKVIIFSRNNKENKKNVYDYKSITQFKLDMLINTTPLGQGKYSNQTPVDKEKLKSIKNLKCVIDFNYNPYNTKFLLESKTLGIKTYNGLEILVNQATYSFEIWNKIKVSQNIFQEVKKFLIPKICKGAVVYGMPLSGKTTLYNCLINEQKTFLNQSANFLSFENIALNNKKKLKIYDLDNEIKKNINQNISTFIQNNSLEEFRNKETKVLKGIIFSNTFENLSENINQQETVYEQFNLIFLGGGTLTTANNIMLLQDYIFFYKKESLEELLNRLTAKEIEKRSLISDSKSYLQLYNKRIKLYDNIYDYLL